MIMRRTYIIAEAGVNHNGDLKLAKKLIDVAVASGVDAVKFQFFKADSLSTVAAAKVGYQKTSFDDSESQQAMLAKLEFSEEVFSELISYSKDRRIALFATGFDVPSLDFLSRISMPFTKIPSGEIDNVPLLRRYSDIGLPILLSTGMANLSDIECSINILMKAGTQVSDITLLHCTSEYPTPMASVNLRAMQTLRASFPGVSIGYSDHTLGLEIPVAAVALGASVIEKHFTLDRGMDGPDHAASLEPGELTDMVRSIRNVELAMGHGWKSPTEQELETLKQVRRSIVACDNISKGEVLSENNLTTKRPGTGVSASAWDDYIGKVSNRDYSSDEQIDRISL